MTAHLYKMLSIAEANEIVQRSVSTLDSIDMDLLAATGYVLAEDITAREPLPPFPASIKDGYAVHSADGAGEYDVAFEQLAGSAPGSLIEGKVAYITTGAPLPEGADAVVQVENTEDLTGPLGSQRRVRIVKAARGPGDDVRAVGSDIKAGEVVLPAGTVIGAAEVGLLATVGAAKLRAYRKPLVGVLSTGDELVEPGEQHLGPGQIRDANRLMLASAASASGCEVVDLGIARDTVEDTEAKFGLAESKGVDVLLTSGGVSMGNKDFIKGILERKGKVHFGRVKMKPGKPLTFATLDASGSRKAMIVFGLPGNPVSSIVTYNLVCLPAIRKLSGHQESGLRRVDARTHTAIKLDAERPEYHRVSLSWHSLLCVYWGRKRKLITKRALFRAAGGGEFAASSTGGQISSRLLSMRSANALLELSAAQGVLPAGTVVSALLIGNLGEMPVLEDLPMIIPLKT